jgi:hypothetical protein
MLLYLIMVVTLALNALPSNSAVAYTGATGTTVASASYAKPYSDYTAKNSDRSAKSEARSQRDEQGDRGGKLSDRAKAGEHQNSPDNNNIVIVQNTTDGKYMGQGRAALELIDGPDVTPGNLAYAESSCVNCDTVAVALQLVLYKRGATNVAPENLAIALNNQCTGCVTVARAVQYVIPVDDPARAGREVWKKINSLNGRLEALQSKKMTVEEATRKADGIIAEFKKLAEQVRKEAGDD